MTDHELLAQVEPHFDACALSVSEMATYVLASLYFRGHGHLKPSHRKRLTQIVHTLPVSEKESRP